MIGVTPQFLSPDCPYGLSTLPGTSAGVAGVCCRDEAGTRQLVFEVSLVQQGGNLLRSDAPVPLSFLEVRPDLRCSQAGRDTWIYRQAYLNQGFVTSPSGLLPGMPPSGPGQMPMVTVRAVLPYPLRAQAGTNNLRPWPFSYDFNMYLSDALNPRTLLLGRNFLQHGIVLWQQRVTHFIPLAYDQEARASSRFGW